MKFSHGELAQMEQAAKNKADNTNRCVCCGEEIPEGRMVCPICENGRSKTKPRYIDANKLIESLGDSVDACKKWVRKMKARNDDEMIARSTQVEATLIEAILRTKAMPTADVVEVIRCKNCRHMCHERVNFSAHAPIVTSYCSFNERPVTDECYCEMAERKTNE